LAVGGGKKYVNFQYEDGGYIHANNVDGKNESDKKFFGIILTPENVKAIQGKQQADLEIINEKRRKNEEAIEDLNSKNLKFQLGFDSQGNYEYFVIVGEVGEEVVSTSLKTQLDAKMETFFIKGGSGNKVPVPLNGDGKIIYDADKKYDYNSKDIKKFAIILTQKNVEELKKLGDDQLSLLRLEPPAPPAPAPAQLTPALANDQGEILKQKILGGIAGGVIGVGGVLLCASALGVGIVSAPVIGAVIGVGVAGAVVGSVVSKPIAEAIAGRSSQRNL